MNNPETCAREHRDGKLGDHWHIDGNGVTLNQPEALQDIGEAADFGVEFAVGEAADIRGLAIFGWLAFEDDGDLLAEAFLDLRVETVIGDVGLTADKPFEERLLRLVENFGPRFEPRQLLGFIRPETFRVIDGATVELIVAIHAFDAGLGDEICGRREDLLRGAEAFGGGLLDVGDFFVHLGLGFTTLAQDEVNRERYQDG